MHRNRMLSAGLACGALLLLLSGCTAVRSHWPFRAAAEAPAQPVAELIVQVPAQGPAPVVLQFWERNTLIVDLQSAPATGTVVLQRRADRPWPPRIAFRAAPQRFEALEVRGAQRVVLPLSSSGAAPVTIEIAPSVHPASTTELSINWGARAAF